MTNGRDHDELRPDDDPEPMTLEIIGAGLGRTATRSLQMALEELGYAPCHHMFEINDHPEQATPFLQAARGDLGPMIEFCGRYRAVVDWPAAAFWRPLSEAYPEAKVILSVRPAEGWHASVLATIYPSSRAIMMARPAELGDVPDMLDEVIWKGTFDGRFRRKEHAIEVYEAHNAEVRAALPPDRTPPTRGRTRVPRSTTSRAWRPATPAPDRSGSVARPRRPRGSNPTVPPSSSPCLPPPTGLSTVCGQPGGQITEMLFLRCCSSGPWREW
jgi:hypothetical protein